MKKKITKYYITFEKHDNLTGLGAVKYYCGNKSPQDFLSTNRLDACILSSYAEAMDMQAILQALGKKEDKVSIIATEERLFFLKLYPKPSLFSKWSRKKDYTYYYYHNQPEGKRLREGTFRVENEYYGTIAPIKDWIVAIEANKKFFDDYKIALYPASELQIIELAKEVEAEAEYINERLAICEGARESIETGWLWYNDLV